MRAYTASSKRDDTFKVPEKSNCVLGALQPLIQGESKGKTHSDICRQKLPLIETFAKRNAKGYIQKEKTMGEKSVKHVGKSN